MIAAKKVSEKLVIAGELTADEARERLDCRRSSKAQREFEKNFTSFKGIKENLVMTQQQEETNRPGHFGPFRSTDLGISGTSSDTESNIPKAADGNLHQHRHRYFPGTTVKLLDRVWTTERSQLDSLAAGLLLQEFPVSKVCGRVVGGDVVTVVAGFHGRALRRGSRLVLGNLGIKHYFSSPYHPQSNGQVEAINKIIKNGLKTRLDAAKGTWPEELPNVLWAYRTTVWHATGETPFSLTYGSEAIVSVELGSPTY
ncbi:gag-pol polyprotein [Striga asiatica]|uniref:Gag-pol polyprotein n=1 Tax=Striga asiatica TaxID=4170 RepID=A0A5A7NYE9_STRAF|nr:gag-pol polyprotein [Striga asiatica]